MPVEGYTSLDSQPYPGVEIVARVPPIPYEDGTVADIYTGHFLEHLPPYDVLPLLIECYRVLAPGGSLTVICPDANKARLSLESKRMQPLYFSQIVCGGQGPDMPHWTLWDKERLASATRRAGFHIDLFYDWKDDERVYDRNVAFQCGVRGVKR